jgi:hypothetical protein
MIGRRPEANTPGAIHRVEEGEMTLLHWKVGITWAAATLLVLASCVGGFIDGFWF